MPPGTGGRQCRAILRPSAPGVPRGELRRPVGNGQDLAGRPGVHHGRRRSVGQQRPAGPCGEHGKRGSGRSDGADGEEGPDGSDGAGRADRPDGENGPLGADGQHGVLRPQRPAGPHAPIVPHRPGDRRRAYPGGSSHDQLGTARIGWRSASLTAHEFCCATSEPNCRCDCSAARKGPSSGSPASSTDSM